MDLLSDNFEKDIGLKLSNNDKEKIRLAYIIGNNNKNNISADIDQPRPIIPKWTPQNGLLSDLSQNFKQVTFSKSKFPFGTSVSNIRYKHLGSWSRNLLHSFNDQLNYVFAHYIVELKITKYNIDKFPSNALQKVITNKLSYCNPDK